jgi:hypothetical protein
MSKAGQNNYKGVNAQAWAALSLFLQYVRDPRFSHIHLEATGFEDFNLMFDNGRKIICESKDRKKAFNYADLKEVLQKVVGKDVGKEDEILIICSNVNKNLVSKVEHSKYWDQIKDQFLKKGYTADMVNLLPQVRFWNVKAGSSQRNVVYALFADLLKFWLPEEEIKRIANSLLVEKIYAGSEAGATYSKNDLVKEANALAVEGRKNSVYYNEELKKREEQFNELQEALLNPAHATWKVPKELSAFSTDFERLRFAKDRLANKHNGLILKNWDPVWRLNRLYVFNFGIFEIFKNNLHTKGNKKYVLNYIKKSSKAVRGFYSGYDYFAVDVAKLVTQILQSEDGVLYIKEVFQIIKDLITFNEKELLYLNQKGDQHDQWEQGQVCELLLKVYSHTAATPKLKREIFELLISAFDITEDDGEYDWHAPKEVYQILRTWLNEDFEVRFKELVNIIVGQYEKHYKKYGFKNGFDGWEHMGGGTSFFSGNYYVGDRHFIGSILQPAIEEFYRKDPIKGWAFIKTNCIHKTKSVSKNKPDFLNRSVYQIVIRRFEQGESQIQNEAFAILKEFILSRKGIPHKSELIYQAISGSQLSPDKKLRLVSLTVDKYGIPVSPFVENITTDLAQGGSSEAKRILEKWYENEKYYSRFMSDHESVANIQKMLSVDIDFAIQLFKQLLNSDSIKRDKDKDSHFSSYNVAVLLHTILRKNYEKGLDILHSLENEKQLSINQQIVYVFSLFHYQGNDDSDDEKFLLGIYADIVDPLLTHYENNAAFCRRFPHAHSRDAFVQFACRLAAKKEIGKALRVIEFFIEDPDPYLPNRDPEDKEDKYNEHARIEKGEAPRSITSVRGWCGWALMKCSILQGRDYLPKIIAFTQKLINDENYYVIHMGCFALTQLARNRLTVLPEKRSTLFLNDDKEKALKMSKDIEKLAFDLLDRLFSWPLPVQKAMMESVLHPFDPIRSLNEKDSLRLVEALTRLPEESISESAPLLIFYSEFRKKAFTKWRLSTPGLYDDLGPDKYNESKFKKMLAETIQNLQRKDPDSCFKFAAQFEHAMRDAVEDKAKYIKLALKYFDMLTNVYGHQIFTLVYQVLEQKFQNPDSYSDRWYSLLIKCLKIEKGFYEEQEKKDNLSQVYWYPALYHSRILELVYEKRGIKDFMQAAKIFFSFPAKMELHESMNLILLMQALAERGDSQAKQIIELMREKNPSKYWDLGRTSKS